MCIGAVSTWSTTRYQYGVGGGPIFLANLHCTGTEATLLECPHSSISLGSCTHDRDVAVRCEGIIVMV